MLGVGALLVIAAAATACTTTAAEAPSPTTSAPATSNGPTTTTLPPTSTTTASSTGTGRPAATVYTCDGNAVVRPSSLIVACADAGMALVQLHWLNWGEATAYATGALQEKQCVPSCGASGTIVTYRASVTVSGLADGRYQRIRIVAPPAPGQPYDLPLPRPGA
jgi:hypothetical protein